MKLFNTKINLNFIKNSAKFFILAFLIIYCIYILYFSSINIVIGLVFINAIMRHTF